MNQTVQEFIKKKDEEYEQAKREERKAFLDRVGLVKKIYRDDEYDPETQTYQAEEYPMSEYVDGIHKYYREEYIDFTDEEYEELKKAQARVDAVRPVGTVESKSVRNSFSCGLAIFFVVLAVIIFLASFIAGIVLAKKETFVGSYYTYTKEEFDAATAFAIWGAGLVSGSMVLGLAHIVEHLHKQTKLLRIIADK